MMLWGVRSSISGYKFCFNLCIFCFIVFFACFSFVVSDVVHLNRQTVCIRKAASMTALLFKQCSTEYKHLYRCGKHSTSQRNEEAVRKLTTYGQQTLIPESMTVMYWNEGNRNARTVQPSRTCSITAETYTYKHYTINGTLPQTKLWEPTALPQNKTP